MSTPSASCVRRPATCMSPSVAWLRVLPRLQWSHWLRMTAPVSSFVSHQVPAWSPGLAYTLCLHCRTLTFFADALPIHDGQPHGVPVPRRTLHAESRRLPAQCGKCGAASPCTKASWRRRFALASARAGCGRPSTTTAPRRSRSSPSAAGTLTPLAGVKPSHSVPPLLPLDPVYAS
jgi:hypothetical protein